MEEIGSIRKRRFILGVICLQMALSAAAYTQSAAEKALLAKAQSLASSGHLDMALQTWRQVLLADANNTEALLGIAKADMQLGKTDEARIYLNRLRAAGGSAADIAKIEAMPNVGPRADRIAQAGELARQGRYPDAMRIYRDVFGDTPPAGNYALAYYDTEAAIAADRPHAIGGLRKLAKQFPADSRYSVTLGRVLTYDPKTRAEGITILRQFSNVPAAQAALSQAETWNVKPPAGATVQAQPQTAETQQQPVRAPSSPEASAYRALNSGRLDEAKRLFQSLLEKQPNSPGALSGLGYVSMKEQDFASAADYLERARAAGAKGVDGTLATAKFWLKMNEAGDRLTAGDSQSAAEAYRDALAMKPNNADALQGLGGALSQGGEDADAADAFQKATRLNPQSAAAWRGLFLARSASGSAQAALEVNDHMPNSVRSQLETDPDYLRALAEDNLAVGRKTEADRIIALALALPFPNEGRDLPVQKQLQYAGLLMTAKKYAPAVRIYKQVVAQDSDNSGAWRALIAAQHQLNDDDAALASVARMPQPVFDKAQGDESFLVLVASIYQSRHDYDRAQKYLEQAIKIDTSARPELSLPLADIYAAQGNVQKAYPIYSQELERSPQNQQAWRGILNSLHTMNRDREALRRVASMPESVRLRFEQDPVFLQTLATLQSSAGQSQAALKTYSQLTRIYAEQNTELPVDVRIQYGWILLKARDDQKLYALVTDLSGSLDMTEEQQAEFNRLWATWSIQRANAALLAGDQRRALAILEAAGQAFPKNPDVYSALAAAYLQAGQARQAVALYAALDPTDFTSAQYQGAIGAALSARDMTRAKEWLEAALDRFQNDPSILKMAAQYEQTRGNNDRAAAYYRAALQAMGPTSAGGGPLSQPGAPLYGPSPTQQLMELLVPSGRIARTNGPEPVDNRRRGDISWQEAPAGNGPTLGDFADTEQVPGDLIRNRPQQRPTSTLAEYAQVERPAETYQSPTVGERGSSAQISDGEPSRGRKVSEKRDLRNSSADRQATGMQATDRQGSSVPSGKTSLPLPSAPVKQESLPPQTEFLKPASTHLAVLEPKSPLLSQDGVAYRGSAYLNDPNPALRLRAAAHEMTGAQETAPALPRDETAPPVAPTPRTGLPTDTPPGASPVESTGAPLAPTLPPLSGAAVRPVRPVKTEREQVEEQLAVLQGAGSTWIGGSSGIDYRSGQPGYDRLAAYSANIESSQMMGPNVRTTVIVRPVLLDTGVPAASTTFQQGTLPAGAIPYVQSAAGVGGEFQLRAASFGASVGYTPYGFLIPNWTAGLYIHPPASHYTITFGRDPITDTQLSYAGLRDLGSKGPTYIGNSWGGVMANAGEVQLAFGGVRSGWYIQGGGQYITGQHVETNKRIDGDAGAYWAVWNRPEYGSLSLGMNFFGMHYGYNLRYFTYGQGGYFSPGAYMLAGIPFTFTGHHGSRLHYRVAGSLGLQAFQEDSTPFYPLDPALQTPADYYPEHTGVGSNYSLDAEGAYAIAEHWYVGGYLNFNNARDYASEKIGFYVRYLFRPQPMREEGGPTGIFPIQGFRPIQVP